MYEGAGQVVLVTGAAQGLGAAIAEGLAAAGATLMLADVQAEPVAALAARLDGEHAGGCSAVWVDVADPAACERMVAAASARWGRVDALVNNAAIDAPEMDAADLDAAHWRRLIDVDLSGTWWSTAAVLPQMLARGQGRVVNISSLAARSPGPRYSPAYVAAKAGVVGLTMALSAQLEGRGVLVNAIAPGVIGTTGTPMLPAERAAYERTHPLGAGGTRPIVDAVLYLLGRSGDWLSGVVLNVTGGAWRGL